MRMKHSLSILTFACAVLLLNTIPSYALEIPVDGTYAFVDVKNKTGQNLSAVPVTVNFDSVTALMSEYKGQKIAAFDNRKPIDLQADDLDHDGKIDELTFMLDLKSGEQRRITLEMVWGDTTKTYFEKGVYAFLAHREKTDDGDIITPDTAISSTANDMYNKVALHGMVMESGPVAYRVYFNDKSTIDVYYKTEPRLELQHTMWHTTLNDQERHGWGADVLLVGNSVGVGTFKEWNGTAAQHTTQFERRTQRIVATGNLRNIMELEVNGWRLANGNKVDARIRFTQYAFRHDVRVDVYLSPDARRATFCTGVQKFPNNPKYITPKGRPVMGIWGTDYPEKDREKYYIQRTVGLAVAADGWNVAGEREDDDNHLFLLKPDNNNHIGYWFTVQSPLEREGIKDSQAFAQYLKKWHEEISTPLQIKLSK